MDRVLWIALRMARGYCALALALYLAALAGGCPMEEPWPW